MKIKVLVGVLVFLIVLNLATIGTWLYFRFVQPEPPGWKQPPPWSAPMRPGMRPPIEDLTRAQRQQLRQLIREMRQAKRPVEQQLRQLHYMLRLALIDSTVSTDSLQVLLDSLASIQRQLNEITIEYFLQAREFLTPQQRQRIFRHLFFPGGRPSHFMNHTNPKPGRYIP